MMKEARDLFLFKFRSTLDSRRADLLRDATGMIIGGTDAFDREPGQGHIGSMVFMWLAEDGAPDAWEIGAHAYSHEYDAEQVEQRRRQIRDVLPKIADTWEEVTP